jgi:hypothetical protein
MANVLNRTTKEYLESVNTPDYPVQDWIIDPDLTAVSGFPARYWVITGDAVMLMDQAQRDALDATLLDQARDAAVNAALDNVEDVLRQIVKLMVDEINILRAQHGLPARTLAQVKTAIRNGYGS